MHFSKYIGCISLVVVIYMLSALSTSERDKHQQYRWHGPVPLIPPYPPSELVADACNGDASRLFFLTYGNDRFVQSKERIRKEADSWQIFDDIIIDTPQTLSHAFRYRFRDILAIPGGGGRYFWKLYIIHRMLQRMVNGDFVMYVDSGCSMDLVSNFTNYKVFGTCPPREKRMREAPHLISYLLGHIHHLCSHNATETLDIVAHYHPWALNTDERYASNAIYEYLNASVHPNQRSIVSTYYTIRKSPISMAVWDALMRIMDKNSSLWLREYNDNQTRAVRPQFQYTQTQTIPSVFLRTLGYKVPTHLKPAAYACRIRT